MVDVVNTRVQISGTEDMKKALDDVATKGDASMAKLSASVNRWTATLDPAFAAQQKFAKGQDTLNAGLDRGIISAGEHARLMDLLGQKFKGTGEAADKAREFTSRFAEESKRAILALGTGNAAGALDSLSRIGLHLGEVTLGTAGWVAALAAIPVAFGAARSSAIDAMNQVKVALVSTGDASGYTRSQVEALAHSLAGGSSLSSGGARDVVTGLIRSGKVGGGAVAGAANLVPDFAAGTGQSVDEASKQLADLLADPTKGAEEVASRFHALSAAQVEEIGHLAARGQVDQAQLVIVKALSDRFAGLGQQMEGFWSHLGSLFSKGVSFAAEQTSKGTVPGTVEDQIAEIRGRIGRAEQFGVYKTNPGAAQALDDLRTQLAQLLAQKGTGDNQASGAKAGAEDAANLRSGLALSGGFADGTNKAEAFKDQIELIGKALATATKPEDVVQLQRALAAATTGADNPYDPIAAQRGVLTAQIANRALPPGQRALANARTQIEDQFSRDQSSGATNADLTHTKALADLLQPMRDAAQAEGIEAKAQQSLAAAYDQGTAAVERQRIANEADKAVRDGRAASLDGEIQRLTALARAQALVATRATEASTGYAADAALRLAGASKRGPAAEIEAQASNQAIEQTRSLSAVDPAAGDVEYLKIKQNLLTSTDAQREKQDNDRLYSEQQALEVDRLSLALQGKSAEQRAIELADLQVRNQLLAEGLQVGTEEYEKQYQALASIEEQRARVQVKLQQSANTDKAWSRDISSGFDQMGSSISQAFSANNGHDLFKALAQDVDQLAFKMLVLEPIIGEIKQALNLPNAGQGLSGGGLGGLLSSLFSGGGAATTESYVPASAAGSALVEVPGSVGGYAKGGAFDGGRPVAYFARGGIFDRPTNFNIGQMGENGPEAVMPLVRMGGGKLGVSSSSGGGGGHQFFIDARGAAPGVEQRIEQVIKMVHGVDASIERRSVVATAQASRRSPRLYSR